MKPENAVFEITNRCNMRCIHCGSDSGEARAGELSTAEALDVIDTLGRMGCRQVTLLGGEILLRDDWADLGRRVHALGMDLILITNGLLVDDRVLDALMEMRPSRVAVSIDGPGPEVFRKIRGLDGFDRVLSAIDRLAGSGLPAVNAVTTFHRLNLPLFDDFIPLFRGKNVAWQVQLAGRAGHRFSDDLFLTREDYGIFVLKVLETLRSFRDIRISVMDDFGYFPMEPNPPFLQRWTGCLAGIGTVGIRSNGDVLPCLSLGDAFVVSNLRREPLPVIWKNESYFEKFRNKLKYLEGVCAACAVKKKCRGGCSEMAHSATGSMFENPYCIRAMETERLLDLLTSHAHGTPGK
jgi:radical SAM protein with 4Fe4S-binding SPASM domain